MQKTRYLFATVLIVLSLCAAAASQNKGSGFTLPETNLIARWDDLNQRVLYHRVLLEPSSVGIYAADAQGRPFLAIDVLKDFPGARGGVVAMENLSGGPNGSIVLFCLLEYDPRVLKGKILSYSSAGTLTRAIEVASYEASALSVDDQGNIYIFATNFLYDVDHPAAVYATLIKYDPMGHVIKTMLPSSNFPVGDYATDYSDQNGGPLLRVTPKGIAVFGARSGRWFLLSQEGEIIAHRDLAGVTRKIADSYKFRRESMTSSFLGPNGWPFFYLRLDDGPFNEKNVPPPDQMRFQEPLVKINPFTGDFVELEKEVELGNRQIIGVDKDGNPVYVIRERGGSAHPATSSSATLE